VSGKFLGELTEVARNKAMRMGQECPSRGQARGVYGVVPEAKCGDFCGARRSIALSRIDATAEAARADGLPRGD